MTIPAFRSEAGTVGQNRGKAVASMQYWHKVADSTLAVPIALLNAAYSVSPTSPSADTNYKEWAVSYGSYSGLFSGKNSKDSIVWKCSATGPGLPANFTWFSGITLKSSEIITWIFYDVNTNEFFRCQWKADGDTIEIKNTKDGDPMKGSYATYTALGDSLKITHHEKLPTLRISIIEWSKNTGAGYFEEIAIGISCWGAKAGGYQDRSSCP